MTILFNLIQAILVLCALCLLLIGIFKPFLFFKKRFKGRRALFLLSSLVLLLCFGLVQQYKVNNVFTAQEREEYYADIKQQEIQDSIKKEHKRKERLKKDSLKAELKTKEDSLKYAAFAIDKFNDSIAATYPCMISNIQIKYKRIVGVGMDAIKKSNDGYAVVAFELKNNSKRKITVEQDNFRLYDGENLYEVSMDAQIEAEFSTNLFSRYRMLDIYEEINPKITHKYKMIFEVPENKKLKLICYNKNVFIRQ